MESPVERKRTTSNNKKKMSELHQSDYDTEPPATDSEESPEENDRAVASELNVDFMDEPTKGAILEAAFVDPAYSWPPKEGEGKNAIELQASSALLRSVEPDQTDTESVFSSSTVGGDLQYPDPPKIHKKTKVITTTETTTSSRCGFLRCCKTEEAVVSTAYEEQPIDENEKQRLRDEYKAAKDEVKQKRKDRAVRKKEKRDAKAASLRARRMAEREKEKYARVPEGILIYRLDTARREVTLMSGPSSNTDVNSLMRHMVLAGASPSADKSRRGICLSGIDGSRATLVACEQRTAIAWLEAIEMMLSNAGPGRMSMRNITRFKWGAEKLTHAERDQVEDQYLNLAFYSNNLIRAGAIPGAEDREKKNRGAKSAGGIFYSVDKHREEGDELDEETLESIAKRRAVIKDSWDFFRMICSLLRDRRKYDEVFRRMQLDPVYPYLNSMTGLNDPGDEGYENTEKPVTQRDLAEYSSMTRTQVCDDLVKRANDALPSLVEICKALAGSLGMEEVGVGPVKEAAAAIRKAEKKYNGDILKVTDYCRALLVVKDFPTLLALLELARDSFGPLIRRVKLSTLKSDHESMPGGYRDCKINLELKDHICEIQVHLWPMWVICGVDGFRHYRHCLEYSTDSFSDPYDALEGLDRKSVAELIVVAEEAVADMPLDDLEWFHEKYILDYFAEAGLFMKHDLAVWAETTVRQLIKLRVESPDIGPDHHETLFLQTYLSKALKMQGKNSEAEDIDEKLALAEEEKKAEKEEAEQSLWDSIFVDPKEAFDMIMDPSKKEREEEERLKKEVKASKRAWRRIRGERFKFLDSNNEYDGRA